MTTLIDWMAADTEARRTRARLANARHILDSSTERWAICLDAYTRGLASLRDLEARAQIKDLAFERVEAAMRRADDAEARAAAALLSFLDGAWATAEPVRTINQRVAEAARVRAAETVNDIADMVG